MVVSIIERQDPAVVRKDFAEELRKGLSSDLKRISSMYFYDSKGSHLFSEITKLSDYYLSSCEQEILETYIEQISDMVAGKKFRLVELGAGDGRKTQILIKFFRKNGLDFEYIPIDISEASIQNLVEDVQSKFSDLKLTGLVGNYNSVLELLRKDERMNFFLFLGSSIGNFSTKHSIHFLQKLRSLTLPQDIFLLGFDLAKTPVTLRKAYEDSEGITKQFNLNLLSRINQEFQANFNLNDFEHHAEYHPEEKCMKSWLLSTKEQDVTIKELNQVFHFHAWEPIHTENSQKYSLQDIERIAGESGFKVLKNFNDSKNYFVDSIWQHNSSFLPSSI